MPAHTPSPHRFLAPNPNPNPHSAPNSTRPHSSLRNAATLQPPAAAKTPTPQPGLPAKKITPAKRFVIAPQKKIASENARLREAGAKTSYEAQPQHAPLPRPRRKLERVESIEEPCQSSVSDAVLDETYASGVIPSTEDQDAPPDESRYYPQSSDDDEMLFESTTRNKRLRMSTPSSPPLQHAEPSTPVAVHNSTTHRFKVAPPPPPPPPASRTPAHFPSIASVAASAATAPSTSHRPHFILPAAPTSPPRPARPPPDIFSPSRKTGKHVPGGLAATVSAWIIEAATTGFAAQERGVAGGAREKEDGVKMRIRVRGLSRGGAREAEMQDIGCYAGGVVFARGEIEPGVGSALRASTLAVENGAVRLLLAGQGGARSARGVKVRVGNVIAVRAPTWEIDVGLEKWLVAVDWVVVV
ncbi:hypothetical protein ACJBU6_00791 [Exserohilum turcicum]